MGYACPVCGDPQADAEHLANHLAFTAMARNDDHEAWLDEHVPDWAESDAESLAAVVTDHAESADFPQVFEDTTDHDHDHDHGRDPAEERSGALFDEESAVSRARTARDRELDDETAQIVEEARELTEAMREGEDEAETE
jgi:hypothetical protein